MPSTHTLRNRAEKQGAGENNNSWGTRLNDKTIDMFDEALDGMASYALSGSKTLSSNNGASDEARCRYQNVTGGSGGTITVPNVEKVYVVRNASSGTATFTTGSGTSCTVQAGLQAVVACEGGNVCRTLMEGGYVTTAAGRALIDDADVAAQRGTLGLGSAALLAETTSAEFRANTADRALSTDQVWAAADYVALTDASTVALDMSAGINFSLTIGGNRTLGNPSNCKNGQCGVIVITQDGTGNRTLAYGGNWKFAGASAPTLSTIAGRRDMLFYQVISATLIYGSLIKDVR